MRIDLPLALMLAISLSTPSYGWELCNLFGFRCGLMGCGGSCEPGCGCDPCAYGGEVGCGCEASCACGSGCSAGCPQYGGQTWNCCESSQVPICECTGASGCCETACGCEPGCGCEPTCGCSSGNGNRGCCLNGLFFGSCCGEFVRTFERLCGGCNGCSSEVYWSEWHNDPPRCHEPCDCYGNFTGPSYGGVRAPYDQGYHVGSAGVSPRYAQGNAAGESTSSSGAAVSRGRVSRAPTYRNESAARPSFTAGHTNRLRRVTNGMRPIVQGKVTRRPANGTSATYQR
jgi:hypothetical protein